MKELIPRRLYETYSRNSFKIWNVPKAGSLRIVYFYSQRIPLELERKADQISHNLTCNIAPADENTPGAHSIPFLLTAMVCAATSHQSLAAFIRPRHDLTDRLGALGQTIHYGNELNFEQLHQVLVTTIAN